MIRGGYDYIDLDDGWSIEVYTPAENAPQRHDVVHVTCDHNECLIAFRGTDTCCDECGTPVPPEVIGFFNLLEWER